MLSTVSLAVSLGVLSAIFTATLTVVRHVPGYLLDRFFSRVLGRHHDRLHSCTSVVFIATPLDCLSAVSPAVF